MANETPVRGGSIELTGSHDNTATFRLSGVLNFDSIVPLVQRSTDLFQPYGDIDVDLSGVTYVNSAGLALLLDWKRQTTATGKQLRIHGVPEKLLNIARLSELENILFTE